MPLQPGDKFGPYECIALIGKGGMGEVWKARDTRLDRIGLALPARNPPIKVRLWRTKELGDTAVKRLKSEAVPKPARNVPQFFGAAPLKRS